MGNRHLLNQSINQLDLDVRFYNNANHICSHKVFWFFFGGGVEPEIVDGGPIPGPAWPRGNLGTAPAGAPLDTRQTNFKAIPRRLLNPLAIALGLISGGNRYGVDPKIFRKYGPAVRGLVAGHNRDTPSTPLKLQLRDSASGPEIGLPGRASDGF